MRANILVGAMAPLAFAAQSAAIPNPAFKLTSEEWQAMCPAIVTEEQITARKIELSLTAKPAPRWPSRLSHIEGDAVFHARIDTNGVPVDIQIVRATAQGFADEAASALLRWRYVPLLVDGKPTCIEADVTFTFQYR